MHREDFTLCNHKLSLFQAEKADCPLIIFNQFSDEGKAAFLDLQKENSKDFHFLAIGNLNWERDLSPWHAPALGKEGDDFTGGGEKYLDCILSEILPLAKEKINGVPEFIGIAGYSLAGLFALYALYKTDVFTRVASMSGSLWFPGIKEFCKENAMKILPEKLYLSIGDKESKTRHPILQTMQENTEDLLKHFKSMGIETTYEVNPGNHFQDVNLRCAKGILELLQ